MVEENVHALLKKLEKGNCFGEHVALVAATKLRTAEEINRAVLAGVDAVAENRVQEFREKHNHVRGVQHFIGHLQTNKVKYLVGKIALYHSIDRDELADELSRRSLAAQVLSEILVQVNIGNEESKGGYALSDAFPAYKRLKTLPNLRVRGFMAMLPRSDDKQLLGNLTDEMRALFDAAKKTDENITWLSMGMSEDWELCVAHGSNMVRLGTAIFGAH